MTKIGGCISIALFYVCFLRLSLPESWRGLRDEELSKRCSIKDCVFVHASGFVGGNKTKEGALTMARESLKIAKEHNDVVEHVQC